MSTLRIKLTVWLALVALLALALTPVLARAISRTQGHGPQWVEVCTGQGTRLVAFEDMDASGTAEDVAGDVDGAMAQASGDLDHCIDSSLEEHDLAGPPTRVPLQTCDGAGYVAPLFLHAPRTLFAWRGPQTRAPPR